MHCWTGARFLATQGRAHAAGKAAEQARFSRLAKKGTVWFPYPGRQARSHGQVQECPGHADEGTAAEKTQRGLVLVALSEEFRQMQDDEERARQQERQARNNTPVGCRCRGKCCSHGQAASLCHAAGHAQPSQGESATCCSRKGRRGQSPCNISHHDDGVYDSGG